MSKPLTKTQLDHAFTRLNEACRKALSAFAASLGVAEPTPPSSPPSRTWGEKKVIIESGQPLKLVPNCRRRTGVEDAFIFPDRPEDIAYDAAYAQYEKDLVAYTAAQQKHQPAIDTERTRLNVIVRQIKDELVMSGDGMGALAKIAAAFPEV